MQGADARGRFPRWVSMCLGAHVGLKVLVASSVLTQPGTAVMLTAASGTGSHPNLISSCRRCHLFVPPRFRCALQAAGRPQGTQHHRWAPEGWAWSSLRLTWFRAAKALFGFEWVNFFYFFFFTSFHGGISLCLFLPAASRGPGDSRHSSSRWFWWCKAQGDHSQELLRQLSQKWTDACGMPHPLPGHLWTVSSAQAACTSLHVPMQWFTRGDFSASDPKLAEIVDWPFYKHPELFWVRVSSMCCSGDRAVSET